ncbi:MAG: class I SAM-dependent methyltransferase, partial [Planctomycetota bacterium]
MPFRNHPGAACLLLALTICYQACSTSLGVEAPDSNRGDLARRILADTDVRGGLIVHLGCGDGKLTAALHPHDGCLVHGVAADADSVAEARKHITSLGLYGTVSVDHYDGKRLPYVDGTVNLVVAEELGEVPMDEVLRVLAPGGVAYVKRNGKWAKTVKPRAEETDEWTHYLYDASNNAVSQDEAVDPPASLQWVSAPRFSRSHEHLASLSAAVASGGRIFSLEDRGPVESIAFPSRWFLVARDAYNGLTLWKRNVGPWEWHLREFRHGPPQLTRRLVAVDDRVYATLRYGGPVEAIDAATGETLTTYAGTDGTEEI